VIRAALRVMLVLCLLSSLVACTEGPPDTPEQGTPEPRRSPTAVTTPEGEPAQAPGTSERTVVESTVGGAILRRDESVLGIDRAELLRSREDEIFVTATVRGPAEDKDCYLMKGSTWFALRDAIENENASEAPEVLEVSWADPASTTSFSGNDTLAVSFQESTDRKDKGPDPRNTPFFAVCYKFASITGDGTDNATWYDVAHVEGTPEAP
jgi:hypothetical protein